MRHDMLRRISIEQNSFQLNEQRWCRRRSHTISTAAFMSLHMYHLFFNFTRRVLTNFLKCVFNGPHHRYTDVAQPGIIPISDIYHENVAQGKCRKTPSPLKRITNVCDCIMAQLSTGSNVCQRNSFIVKKKKKRKQ